MEEVGAQVAPPSSMMYLRHNRFCDAAAPPSSSSCLSRKRDYYSYHQQLQSSNYLLQQQEEEEEEDNSTSSNNKWNPKAWDWDSSRFVAKPHSPSSNNEQQQDDHRLKLNLGNTTTGKINNSSILDESVSRSTKRLRSRSPGHPPPPTSGPVCQVDDCKQDLSIAKDYHRRHKVCQLHSKSTQALVSNHFQRFCQQCSRFHPLSEFDEGKRSCRRRLAGHNRRRRKTQPEDDVTSPLSNTRGPTLTNSIHGNNLDIITLLSAFARPSQGKTDIKDINLTSVSSDKDQLIQILSKINSFPIPMDLVAKLPNLECFNGNTLDNTANNKLNLDISSPSTMDLLPLLSATLAASAPNAPANLSCHSTQSTESEKTSLTHTEVAPPDLSLQNRSPREFPSGIRSSTSCQSHNDNDSDCQVQETQGNLELQLFSSSPENDSPPKLDPSRKYFSSGSSNPIEERSPSLSPPITRNLFPIKNSSEAMKSRTSTISAEATKSCNMSVAGKLLKANVQASRMPLELFTGPDLQPDQGSNLTNSCQAGYYSSGSDHSPSSWNSDMQDRTGRIIFKLFDKDPSHFPATLREQIYNWLSNSPSEMESYIRPGCVILSIYASMSSAAWTQLEQNLVQCVKSLVQDPDCEFWRSGRFMVHTGQQLASHREGNIRICKSWKTRCSPELISVSPLAVISGKETSFLLRGRNLSNPGTKIHFTYMGGYASKEVAGSLHSRSPSDERTIKGIKIPDASFGVLGRCYIEVENGFKGNSFPVIIADATICDELRLLESVFDEEVKACDAITQKGVGSASSREEVLHFLNEIGWLFQRKWNPCIYNYPDYSVNRFKFVIIFSIERDFCALIKTLLDILVERQFDGNKLSKESMEMLSEVQLLNRAVKRRCCKMLDLLIQYFIVGSNDASKIYLFPPNMSGPGRVTPLHLAACTAGSDDLIDALTNDPQQIGLHCWTSLLDATGQSPHAYATMRNNQSYNSLVARKLADRRNGQVSLTVRTELEQERMRKIQHDLMVKTCAKCAAVPTNYRSRSSGPQSWLYRPYITSVLAIAAVCVCVCLFFRGSPDIGMVEPFKWENLDFGTH